MVTIQQNDEFSKATCHDYKHIFSLSFITLC